MELEEHIIGRTRDFYAGSRQEKYGHTMGRAEKLKRQREKQRVNNYHISYEIIYMDARLLCYILNCSSGLYLKCNAIQIKQTQYKTNLTRYLVL